MGVSMTRLHNRCSHERIDYDIRGVSSGSLYRGNDIERNAHHQGRIIELRAYDRKGRQIKYISYFSDCDDQWEIDNWGVRLTRQRMHSHSGRTREGTSHYWQQNNESYYQDMDRREEEQRQKEARERAAREKAKREERQRAEAAAQERETDQMAAMVESDIAERDQASHSITVLLQEQRQQAQMNAQISLGWRTANSKASQKNISDSLKVLGQETAHDMSAVKLCTEIMSDSLTKRDNALVAGFELVALGSKRSFPFVRALKDFLKEGFSYEDASLMSILKNHFEMFPPCIDETIAERIVLEFSDVLRTNEDLFSFFVMIFKRMCAANSPWQQEIFDEDSKKKLFSYIETYGTQLRLNKATADGKENIIAEELLDNLKTICNHKQAFPKSCMAESLNVFGIVCSQAEKIPNEAYDFFVQLDENDFMIPVEIIDLITKHVSTELINKQEAVLKIGLNSGLISVGLLDYLETAFKNQVKSTFTQSELLEWIGEYVQNGGQISIGFFETAVRMMNHSFSSEREFVYLLSILEFCFINLDSALVWSELQRMQIQLPFLRVLKDSHTTHAMKSHLMRLMSKLLNTDYFELDKELLQTVFNIASNAKKEQNIETALNFLQIAVQINVSCFQWLTLPTDIFNASNLLMTQLLTLLLVERLQSMKESGNYEYEINTKTLKELTEVLAENSPYVDKDILSNCLKIFAIEIQKEKSRTILEPFCDNISWLEAHLKNANPVVRENVIYVMSELVQNHVGNPTSYFTFLASAMKNWPTEQAHRYATTALITIISHFNPDEPGNLGLLQDFLLIIEPSLFSSFFTLAEGAYSVLEAWVKKVENRFQSDDFKILCRMSSAKYGVPMVQRLFAFALGQGLEPKNEMIEELKKIAEVYNNCKLPTDTSDGFQKFLCNPINDLEQKAAIAEIMAAQYRKDTRNPDPTFFLVLESAVSSGASQLVQLCVCAAHGLASFSALPEASVEKLWEIVFDPRVYLSVRKKAFQTILLVVKSNPDILQGIFLDKVINLFGKVDFRPYALFILCYPAALQLSPTTQKQLTTKLSKLVHQRTTFKSIETMAPTADEELSFQLSVCILKKMAANKQLAALDKPTEMSTTKTFNWMIEWLSIHPEDAEAFVQTENARANKMIRTNLADATGHSLKIEVMLTRANLAITSKDYSKANSWLDKATNYTRNHALESFDSKIEELLARCYASSGNHRAAIKLYKKLLKNPNVLSKQEIGYAIARSMRATGRYNASLKAFQELKPSQRFGYFWETQLCEGASCLYEAIHAKTGSQAIAKAQIKFLLTTTQYDPPKKVCTLLEFLVNRGEYYDMSVLATQPQHEWELEFLKREVCGRATPNGNEFEEFEQSFLKLKQFFKTRNREGWVENIRILVSELLENQKKGLLQSIQTTSTVMLLLRIPLKTGTRVLTESDTEEELINQLQVEWLKSVLSYHKINVPTYDDQLKEFWSVVKQSPTIHEDVNFIEDFFDATLKSNTLEEIISFFGFCQSNEIETGIIRSFVNPVHVSKNERHTLSLENWKKSFKRCQIVDGIDKMWHAFGKSLDVLKSNLLRLYDRGQCSSEDLFQLVQSFVDCDNKEKRTKDLVDILTVYNSYNLSNSPAWGGLHSLWQKADSSEWKSMIKDVVLNKIISSNSTDLKSTNKLIEEFLKINNGNEESLSIIETLPSLITQIAHAEQSASVLAGLTERRINEWNKTDIESWKNKVKRQPFLCEDSYLPELLAVMQRAMYLFKGYSLREVGVMSICILLRNKGKGCIAKIATGEGKSGIVATLAAIKSLQGLPVDIVTSSPILAARDAIEWQPFFALFGISVKDNSGYQETPNIPKSCYTMDVVYGDASTFEGDVLRHEFNLLGTRGNRKFKVVIVDEVDSMFIDGSNHSTRLIAKMPQMDYLESVFGTIWYTVAVVSAGLAKIDGETFALVQPCGKSDELIKAVFSVLSPETKETIKCNDAMGLKLMVENFASTMEKAEKQEECFRRQVVNLLQNRKLHPFLMPNIQAKLKDLTTLSEITATSDIVDDYITSKWRLGVPVNLRNVLEAFLDVEIFVYYTENERIVPCGVYHSEPTEGRNESDDTKQKLCFFIAENELYSMSKVPNDRQFIAMRTEELLRRQVTSSAYKENSANKICIPGHLFELFNTKIDEWIQSAIQAMFSLNLNSDYIIKPGGEDDCDTITPVDYRNTGVTQESCVWGEGLHQFLQIKHHLRITPEYLATNFISNLSFFQRYGTNIFGLTGTIGDENEIELLKHLYSLITLNVPTFKPKRLLELQSVVANDSSEWLTSILNSTVWEIECGRSVLIISKTIDEVERIHSFLKTRFESNGPSKVLFRIYSRSDDSQAEAVVATELNPGTIVIATNLAGRGTNIKLSKNVERNGGLHVIISFLPTNLRVEEQAAGRAARSGAPGTCQLILNAESDIMSYEDESSLRIENIKMEREANESLRVEHIKTTLAKELYIEEKQFRKFCELQQYITKGKHKIGEQDHILDGVGERWAVQLEETKTRCDILDWNAIDMEFDRFFSTLRQEVDQDSAVRNPSYYILKGNDLILRERFKEGIHCYEKAMALDSVFIQNAYYNRAYAIINAQEDGYKETAMKDLQTTADLIQTYSIPYLSNMHFMVEKKYLKPAKEKYEEDEMSSMKTDANDSDFTKQIVGKVNFHYLQLRSITEACKKISETKANLIAKFSDSRDYYAKHDQDVNYSDVSDMQDNGFVAFMYIEKKPVPWYNVLAVFILGLVQAVVGACLCLIGAVNFGIRLIGEGIADFITGITAASTGEFSWNEYWQEKGIGIGVAILLLGVGRILKAVAKLPKIAMVISKVTAIATKVGKTVASIGMNVATQVKNFPSYWYNVTTNCVSKLTTPFRSIGSKLTSSRPWAYFRNCLKTIKKKVIELGEKIKNIGKFVEDKVYSGFSERTSNNLKLAGRVIGQQALNAGLIKALDDKLLSPIGDEIEKQIQSTTAEFLRGQLAVGAHVGDKLERLLKSCMGKKIDRQITAEMEKVLEEDITNGQKWYRGVVKEIASYIHDEIKDKDFFKAKTSRGALLKFFGGEVLDALKRSVTLVETIKSLATMLPELMTQLGYRLEEVSQQVENHEHVKECKGENQSVNNNDIPTIKEKYINSWSKTVAKRMREMIINNVLKPQVDFTATTAINKMTNEKKLNELLLKAAGIEITLDGKKKTYKNGNLALFTRQPGISKAMKVLHIEIKISESSNSKVGKETKEMNSSSSQSRNESQINENSDVRNHMVAEGVEGPLCSRAHSRKDEEREISRNKEQKNDVVQQALDDKPRMDSRSFLNTISSHNDGGIELYGELDGQLRYKESFGSRKHSEIEPVRLFKRVTASGEEVFSPIIYSPKTGELQIMEFEVHPKQKSGELKVMEFKVYPEQQKLNDSLVKSIMVSKGKTDFTPSDVKKYHEKVTELCIGRKPRFVRLITDDEIRGLDRISRDVVLCKRSLTSPF